MLDSWLIEELEREEKERSQQQAPEQLELPYWDEDVRPEKEIKEERGIVTIEY